MTPGAIAAISATPIADMIFRIERFDQRPLERGEFRREYAFGKRCSRFDERRQPRAEVAQRERLRRKRDDVGC